MKDTVFSLSTLAKTLKKRKLHSLRRGVRLS